MPTRQAWRRAGAPKIAISPPPLTMAASMPASCWAVPSRRRLTGLCGSQVLNIASALCNTAHAHLLGYALLDHFWGSAGAEPARRPAAGVPCRGHGHPRSGSRASRRGQRAGQEPPGHAGIGGLAGAYTGAGIQSRLPDVLIRRLVGALVVAIAIRYLWAAPGLIAPSRWPGSQLRSRPAGSAAAARLTWSTVPGQARADAGRDCRLSRSCYLLRSCNGYAHHYALLHSALLHSALPQGS